MESMKAKELKVKRLKIEANIAELELKIDQEMENIKRIEDHIKIQQLELEKVQKELEG